jgi:hypothetical protein
MFFMRPFRFAFIIHQVKYLLESRLDILIISLRIDSRIVDLSET